MQLRFQNSICKIIYPGCNPVRTLGLLKLFIINFLFRFDCLRQAKQDRTVNTLRQGLLCNCSSYPSIAIFKWVDRFKIKMCNRRPDGRFFYLMATAGRSIIKPVDEHFHFFRHPGRGGRFKMNLLFSNSSRYNPHRFLVCSPCAGFYF